MPTFTNPNNTSIVTGAPPAVHGISGNYYLDRATGEERMITDGSLMRCGTILAAMSNAGVRTAAVTAKDKLRLMLARGLEGINFSSEHADRATQAANGIGDVEAMVGRGRSPISIPPTCRSTCSMRACGCSSARRRPCSISRSPISCSTRMRRARRRPMPSTAPSTSASPRMVAAGAIVGVVADHGMNDKSRADGAPNVVFLQEELNRRFGDGAVRVICPITDPFVRHHGALGSFVRVYAKRPTDLEPLMAASRALPGVELVLDGAGGRAPLRAAARPRGRFRRAGRCQHRRRRHAAPSTTCRASPATACARTAASASRRCRSWSRSRLRPDWVSARKASGLRNFDIFDAVLNGVDA